MQGSVTLPIKMVCCMGAPLHIYIIYNFLFVLFCRSESRVVLPFRYRTLKSKTLKQQDDME